MKRLILLVTALLIILTVAFVTATQASARTIASSAALPGNTTLPTLQQPPTATDTVAVVPGNSPAANPVLRTPASGSGDSATTLPSATPTTQPTRQSAGPSGAQTAGQARPTATALPTATGPYQPYKQETLAMYSQKFGAERIAEVYLPGSYAQNPDQRYPVLYSFDGQQLLEMNFTQTLNQLVSGGQIAPMIVVGVFSTEGDARAEELGTGPTLNMLGWGTKSDAFNQFIVDELVPKVAATYRTLTGAAHTAVMGWSLGGLTAFYLAWQYPDVFGTVGAFSPSFWWRTPSAAGQELQARVIPNLVQSSPARPGLRAWFEAGTAELPFSDIDHNGVIDMIQDVQDVMSLLSAKGYQAGADMAYVQVQGGLHELSTWETVMPNFLEFAYGAK